MHLCVSSKRTPIEVYEPPRAERAAVCLSGGHPDFGPQKAIV